MRASGLPSSAPPPPYISPTSPYISLHLPISPHISLCLPISPACKRASAAARASA